MSSPSKGTISSTATTVAVYNTGGSTWSGTITFPAPSSSFTTKEWISDASVGNSVSNGQVTISVSVPPYDVKVFALEH